MRLIIVESPAKCSKIQGFLGLGNKVIASMGHIRTLVHDLDAIGINKGFEPSYEFMKEKASAIAQLKAAAKQAESIILCSDDDREGLL
jgi:DNA topoisomerase-1